MATEEFGLLEEPGLSRQWVLRRLQRALTLDLAAAALKAGIAAAARGPSAARVAELARSTGSRAESLVRMIEQEGSSPYSSVGLSRALSRVGGRCLGLLGRAVWLPLLRRLAEHSLSEYDTLAAMVTGALGVSERLSADVEPLLRDARSELELLQTL